MKPIRIVSDDEGEEEDPVEVEFPEPETPIVNEPTSDPDLYWDERVQKWAA